MIKARIVQPSGRLMLLIGLSPESVARLQDEPLTFDAGDLGFEPLQISLVAGDRNFILARLKTDPRFAGDLELLVDPNDGQPPRPGPDQVAAAIEAVRAKWPTLTLRDAERMVQTAVDAAWARSGSAA